MCPELEYHSTIKKTLNFLQSVIEFQSKNKDKVYFINQKSNYDDSLDTENYFQSVFELQESLKKLNTNCYFLFLFKNNVVTNTFI
jgi:hypothetical protein